ncbi:hypothetical protein [Sandarakinorhabdus sp.]|uniref:hypothetical protein n=1 Tax=Sandarakinorhabdus sp. TaxID=1916663 RepID=UPI00286E6B1A|nr:hypothetical protein [Sandarakinorhabdus sp.]
MLGLLMPACVSTEPAPRTGTAGLAPPPPGWFAFCASHGGASAECDPIPPASAMPDSRPALAPPAWRDYCHRHPRDIACSG